MRGPRLSLAGLLGIVAVAALGLAGLKSASTLWTAAAATLTLGLILSALLGVGLLRGDERDACLGFALFGIAYLVLVDWDWMGGQFGHDLTAGLQDLADGLVPDLTAARANPAGTPILLGPAERQVRVGNVLAMSRMLLALLFGAAGGGIAAVFSRRGRRVDHS